MKRLAFLAGSLLVAIAVSSCSSSQDVLDPSAIVPLSVEMQAAQDSGALPTQDTSASLSPAVASRTRLHFDPIVGATVNVATPLTERLAARARARGITLTGSSDSSTSHVMKGYFSTISEGRQTTVLYVWDIYDPSGNRLHRINGKQNAGGSGEGWNAVSASAMQAIADDTISQLVAWLAGGTG